MQDMTKSEEFMLNKTAKRIYNNCNEILSHEFIIQLVAVGRFDEDAVLPDCKHKEEYAREFAKYGYNYPAFMTNHNYAVKQIKEQIKKATESGNLERVEELTGYCQQLEDNHESVAVDMIKEGLKNNTIPERAYYYTEMEVVAGLFKTDGKIEMAFEEKTAPFREDIMQKVDSCVYGPAEEQN